MKILITLVSDENSSNSDENSDENSNSSDKW